MTKAIMFGNEQIALTEAVMKKINQLHTLIDLAVQKLELTIGSCKRK